ncbi:MAG: hypothetical protein AABX13_05550, partial [Nanoarchaeota archaeon]
QMPILRTFARQIEQRYGIQPEEYFSTLCSGQGIEIGVGAMQQFISDVREHVFYRISNETMKNYYAQQIQLAPGLPEWFPRINEMAKKVDLTLEHHVVSAGFTPLIEGSIIAPYLASIRSGTFIDDEKEHNGKSLSRIKTIVDPNNKREKIIEICKGKDVHKDIPIDDYALRYSNVIVFGDGHSDKRMFNFIRERGGRALGVYEKDNPEALAKAQQELTGRVHYLVPRDYSAGRPLEKVVEESLHRIAQRSCRFDYRDIHALLLHHLEDEEQIEFIRRHWQSCADCQERGKETKVY